MNEEPKKEEDLKWEKRDRLGFTKIVDQISDVSRQVVSRELVEISNKIEILQKMGYIQDGPQFQEMQAKLKKLKLKEK